MEKLKEELEKRRLEFLAYFKRAKTLNYIVLGLALVVFIAAFIFFTKIEKQAYALITSLVVIVVLFFYVNMTKRNVNQYTTKYIKQYYEDTTKQLMNSLGVKEITYLPENEITLEQIENAHIMKDVCVTKSRNNIQVMIDNKSVQLGDLMFKCKNSQDPKQMIVAFCGKFIQYKVKEPFKGRSLLYRKTVVENCYGPNDIEGLEKNIDDELLLSYTNDENFNKTITKDILKLIKSIKIDETLYDVTFSLCNDTVTILLSYTDSVTVIPLYNETPIDAFVKEENDLKIIKEIIQKI